MVIFLTVKKLTQNTDFLPGRGVLQTILCVDVPAGLLNFYFRYTQSCPHLPPINIPFFFAKNTRFCYNWMLFTIICSKYTQFIKICFFHRDESPIAKPKSAKSAQKSRHIYVYHANVSTPPDFPVIKGKMKTDTKSCAQKLSILQTISYIHTNICVTQLFPTSLSQNKTR